MVKNNKMDTGDDDNMNNMNLTETYVLKTTGLGIGYFSTLSECKNADDVKSGNLNNIILKPFNFESVIDISMVPNNDIVPWVKSVSKMPILHVSISPTHVESIMYLHSRLLEDDAVDDSTERRGSSIGTVPVGFKNLISATTPPRKKKDTANKKHRLKLHGVSSSSAYDVNDGNKRIKGNKLILGRVYFSYQFNVKGINMRLQENQNMASTFMSFNIDDIKLNTYIRLDDSLLESSVKNIKVVDNKAVDDWDNGTVFEVTDSDDTVSSNTNDNSSSNSEDEIDASSAMYMSLFLCKTFTFVALNLNIFSLYFKKQTSRTLLKIQMLCNNSNRFAAWRFRDPIKPLPIYSPGFGCISFTHVFLFRCHLNERVGQFPLGGIYYATFFPLEHLVQSAISTGCGVKPLNMDVKHFY